MKKILIVITSFEMGGTLASLNNLLSVLDEKDISVDVFALAQKGDFYGKLPNCTILDENIWLSHAIYHHKGIIRIFARLRLIMRRLFEYVGIDLYRLFNYIGGKQIHSENYDAVIGYDETMARIITSYPAKKRINWIHCDYRRYANGKNEAKYYDRIDQVVCVSEFAKKVFTDIYPQYEGKVYAIHNVINVDLLVFKAKEPIDDCRFRTDKLTIISCGRLDPVKQFSKIPLIASKIKKTGGLDFRWYIIGGGDTEEQNLIETEIANNKIEENVILLGMISNPYPYLAKANLYVCTSFSESFPMVLNEAKALSVPVVSNDFPSVRESVRDGVDGYICSLEQMPSIIEKSLRQIWIINDTYRDNNRVIVESIKEII